MPSVKKLYVAKSMKELESEIPIDVKFRSTNLLITTANKVFAAAETSFLDKDEEKAYVQYMRFIELVLLLKSREEFSQDPRHKSVLRNANPALVRADHLKDSLLKRYSILQEAASKEKSEIVSIGKAEVHEAPNPEISVTEIPSIEAVDEVSISSLKLHSLLTSLQLSIIIMDTRPAKDFAESHIRHSHCINVPQEILSPGITAAKLESLLPKESLLQWYKRSEVDLVVLLDWDSKDDSTSMHINALKQAMSKWDQKCTLKKSPLILEGGYKDWMLKFPMYTTQTLQLDLMNDVKLESSPVAADLSAVEYPDFDENFSEKSISPGSKENLNGPGVLFKHSTNPLEINGFLHSDDTDSRKSKSAPVIDRKSKPNISRESKSSFPERKQNISDITNVVNPSTKGYSSQENKYLHAVDKKIKPSVTSPTLDKEIINSNEDLINSLNKKENLVKENLDLVQQQLKKEEEFEKLRLRKELEAEESKRKEIQKQELILLEMLKKLELEAQEKDAAYRKVKEDNLKMNKLLEQYMDKDYKKKEKEIIDAEKKKKDLQEEVERLRKQRKEKEAQARKNNAVPKPSIPRETVSANSGLNRNSHQDQSSSKNPNSSEYSMPLSRENSQDGSSRGLVRSHSSPNIAQMVNQEETTSPKTPVIDRSLKPKTISSYQFNEINRARLRNLNPVYGNCPVCPATGLKNLGNTCFMNSIIQCLSNTIALSDYITSGQYISDINRNNKQGTGGELAEEFGIVIKSLWMGQYKSFSPKDFKNTVSKCLSVCIGNEQQDSHEFLLVLMEKLHADLKKNHMKSVPKLETNADENIFWQHHKLYNCSKISDIFEGLLKSTLTCLSCRKTSDTFEVFSCLSVPILNTRCSLKECFQHFLTSEKIYGEAAWDCPRCKQKKEAEKRLRICRLPEVLIIQLKRFSYEGLWRRKLQTHVDFDLIFDVPCEVNAEEQHRSYNLYGIVNHYGTLEGGHYTAYCKARNRKWYKYDDQEVSEISSSEIKTSAAYLLFYEAVDFQSNL